MPVSADQIIDRLGLAPHPEGGWYRETWRAPGDAPGRGAATAILFLLKEGLGSHWHRIDATELWLFQAGAPLLLRTSPGETVTDYRLGSDILAGDRPQARVAPGEWQSAQSLGDWSLVACIVVPAFDFAHFELAPKDWSPSAFGPHA